MQNIPTVQVHMTYAWETFESLNEVRICSLVPQVSLRSFACFAHSDPSKKHFSFQVNQTIQNCMAVHRQVSLLPSDPDSRILISKLSSVPNSEYEYNFKDGKRLVKNIWIINVFLCMVYEFQEQYSMQNWANIATWPSQSKLVDFFKPQ